MATGTGKTASTGAQTSHFPITAGGDRDLGCIGSGCPQANTAGAGGAGNALSNQVQAGNGGTAAGAGNPGAGGPGNQSGLVASSGNIGNAAVITVIGITAVVFSLAALEVISAPIAIALLIGLAGIDIATRGITNMVGGVENWFAGRTPGSPFAPGGALAKFASGYLGDFVIAVTISGIIYWVSHRSGSPTIEISTDRPVRSNPTALRNRRHRREKRVN